MQDTYKSRTLFTKIIVTEKGDKRSEHKIAKVDGPAPGLYNVEESLRKTQWINKKPANDKQKIVGFIEKYNKLHKLAPGVGTYQNVEKGYSRLSRSPKGLSIKRH